MIEMAVKTGEGDPRDDDGRVQSGPEYLTVLDGRSGKPVTQIDWPSREHRFVHSLSPGPLISRELDTEQRADRETAVVTSAARGKRTIWRDTPAESRNACASNESGASMESRL